MSILSQDLIQDAIAAERQGETFPVDFDSIWQSVEYSKKSDAVERLKKTHTAGEDYIERSLAGNSAKPKGGRPRLKIYLTIDASKSFCMVAETKKGREVRRYFIDIEKAYRTQLERQLLASLTPPQPDNTRYNITFWKVRQDSGIVDPWYVRNVILAKYDHRMVNDLICVTQKTYEDLLENFRSQAGTDISNLPPEKQAKFKCGEASKKNRREPQQRDDGQ